jgi:Rrf2 family nitric oxide-sensitive transcriptional repressor
MRLTDYTDYAMRTLMYLGQQRERLVTIREISDAYGISNNHLTKVVHQLGLSGMVQTLRGRGGGLRLAMEPGEINLGAVVRLTEPDFDMVECFDPVRNDCVLAPACQLKDVLRQATDAWLAILDGVTLDQILSDPKALPKSAPLLVLRRLPAASKKA